MEVVVLGRYWDAGGGVRKMLGGGVRKVLGWRWGR